MNDSRLAALLEKLREGRLDEDECRELMEWFGKDESRLAALADELRMDNALAALHVLDSDGIAPAVTDSLLRAQATTDISQRVRQQIENGRHRCTVPVERPQWLSRKWTLAWIASAAVVLLMLGWFALPSNRTSRGSTAVIAHVTHQVDAVWLGEVDMSSGEITAGLLELQSGIARLDFDNGASVTLQGPAAYEIAGPMDTRLHYGVLTARIPESAVGFTVETSAMDVVDLGTAFGVSVDAEGVTDVSVFEGAVEVRPPRSRSNLLLEGEAVRGGGIGKQLASVQFDSTVFERVWPVALGVSQTKGAVRFVRPGPPWDLTEHRDDNDIVIFPEAERIHLRQPIGVDSIRPGELLRGQATEGHTIPSGSKIRSYLLQFNPTIKQTERIILTGEITFNQPIAGIIWNADRLAQTDAVCGAEASQYEFPGRGVEPPRTERPPGAGRDRIFLSEDRRTLKVKLNCSVHLDQIRVLVETN
jgi:hypothetical protein